MEVTVDRAAGLDVHKDTVTACVRTPKFAGGRDQQVREFRTFTHDLRRLRLWLSEQRVTHVAMEATGVYWRPVWHVLEDLAGVELLLVNAHHVKNVPGRKTDVSDAAWLAQLLECGLLRGSFVPPPVIARLRDLTRYRKKLVEARASETQRIQKLLEDAGIKLDSVVSDVLGKSAREMLDALIQGGQRSATARRAGAHPHASQDPGATPRFGGPLLRAPRAMLEMHLDHVDHLTASIARIDDQVDEVMSPFGDEARRLQTIPASASAPPRSSSQRSAST